jgi:diguanylate cyclase (GGDEF)-like protein
VLLLRRFTIHLLLPGGLLAIGALLLLQFWQRPPEVAAFLPLMPALVLLSGLLLGWRFNRSRLVYALLVLTVADLCLKGAGGDFPLVAAVGLLLPLNLLLIALYAERGLWTPVGLFRIGLIGVQPFLLFVFWQQYPQQMQTLLTAPLFIWPKPLFTSLPHPALAATFLTGLILLMRILRRPSALEAGLFWVLVCALTPLFWGMEGLGLTLWFAVAGIILAAALIESSHSMAFRDELTGLPARRALNEALLQMGRTYVVAMVDVDHFKKVNDTHGHDVGDQVLKMVAGRLEKVTGGGRPFRYGGEEFTVLFPGLTAKEALPHLDDLREAIGAATFTLRDPSRPRKKSASGGKRSGTGRLSVTVSIGVSERRDGCHAEAVIKSADQALYKAKRTGRNRVCVQAVRSA